MVSETNVKAASPGEIPVTKPVLFTEAIEGCELVQDPPVVGDNVELPPRQSDVSPVMETVGRFITCTGSEALDAQPLEVEVNIKVEEPGESPVTKPSLLMEATAPLVESQVPPAVGVSVVVLYTHIESFPVMCTTGVCFAKMVVTAVEEQPISLVTVTTYVELGYVGVTDTA